MTPTKLRAMNAGGTAQQIAQRAKNPAPNFATLVLLGFMVTEQLQEGSEGTLREHVPVQSSMEVPSVILVSF